MKKTTAEIHRFLHDKRKELGLSQADVARKAGISQAYLSVLENGQFGGTVRTLERVANAIEYDVLLHVAPSAKPLIDGLKKLTKGMAFESETDSPLEVVGPFLVVPEADGGKIHLWLDREEFRADYREIHALSSLFRNHTRADSPNAHRWEELKAFFDNALKDPRAYVFRKTGSRKSRALVVGEAPGSQLIGVTFEIVET